MTKIIYVSAPWCNQCRVLKPRFLDECKRLGLEEGKDYEFTDADEDEAFCLEWNVRNLPTLLFVRDGEEIGRETGLNAWEHIKEYM